jgi:hypothetical protein
MGEQNNKMNENCKKPSAEGYRSRNLKAWNVNDGVTTYHHYHSTTMIVIDSRTCRLAIHLCIALTILPCCNHHRSVMERGMPDRQAEHQVKICLTMVSKAHDGRVHSPFLVEKQ